MKIGVCFKSTPGTDVRVNIASDGTNVDLGRAKLIVNPYDEFAVEEGVRTKEAHGGEVVVFSVGADTKNVSDALAAGADRAVLIDDPALADAGTLGVATALAAAIKEEGCDVLFCGKVAIDHQNGQVPAMVAELLGWPHVSLVTAFSTEGGTFTATRAVGGGVEEVVTGPLPAVFTAERGLNKPRYGNIKELMKAKKKPKAKKTLADLGVDAAAVAPRVHTVSLAYPPERPKGRMIEGDAATAARELVRLLREEAKVI